MEEGSNTLVVAQASLVGSVLALGLSAAALGLSASDAGGDLHSDGSVPMQGFLRTQSLLPEEDDRWELADSQKRYRSLFVSRSVQDGTGLALSFDSATQTVQIVASGGAQLNGSPLLTSGTGSPNDALVASGAVPLIGTQQTRSLLPTASATYSLGDGAARYRDLFLSQTLQNNDGASLTFGTDTLDIVAPTCTLNGAALLTNADLAGYVRTDGANPFVAAQGTRALTPTTDNAYSLGTSAARYLKLWSVTGLGNNDGANIAFSTNTIGLTATTCTLNGSAVATASDLGGYVKSDGSTLFAGNFVPSVNATHDLGTGTLRWDKLFTSAGFTNNDGVDLALSANAFALTSAAATWNGASLATVDDLSDYVLASGATPITGTQTLQSLLPSADATYSVGSSAARFANAFLSGSLSSGAAGGVVLDLSTANTLAITASSGATLNGSAIVTSASLGGPYLPLAGGTMSGTINLNSSNLTNVTTLSGAAGANSGAVANLVRCAGTSTANRVAVFSDTSGKLIADGGVLVSALATGPGSSVAGNFASFLNTGGLALADSGFSAASFATPADLANYVLASGATPITGTQTLRSLLPSADATYSMGSSSARFLDAYLGGSLSSGAAGGVVLDFSTANTLAITASSGATLNGSALLTAASVGGPYLALAGGTMSGSINLNASNLTNVTTLSGAAGANSGAVANLVRCAGTSTTNRLAVFSDGTGKLLADGGVLVSDVNTGPASSVAGNLPAFADAQGKILADSGYAGADFLLLSGTTPMEGTLSMDSHPVEGVTKVQFAGTGQNVVMGSPTTEASGTSGTAVGYGCLALANASTAVGVQAQVALGGTGGTAFGSGSIVQGNSGLSMGANCDSGTGADCIAQGRLAVITGGATGAIAMGISCSNGTSNSFLFGNSSVANFRPNNTGTCDLGTSAARFKDAHLSGSLVGSSLTTSVNSIASGPASSVSGNFASFSGTGGKALSDSGFSSSSFLPSSGGTLTGTLDANGQNITNIATISGAAGANSGTVATLVRNSGTSTLNRIATFADTTGKAIADSGTLVSDLLPKSGGTMLGPLSMGNFALSGVSTIDGSGAVSLGASTATSTAVGRTGQGTTINAGALTINSTTSTTFTATNPNPLSRGQRLGLVAASNTANVVISATTTPTSAFGTVSGSLSYPANSTATSMVIRLRVWYSVTGFGGGGTLAVNAYIDGTGGLGHFSPAPTVGSGLFEAELRVAASNVLIQTAVLYFHSSAVQIQNTTSAWDPTVSHTVDVRFTWSVLSASNSVTSLIATCETLNQA